MLCFFRRSSKNNDKWTRSINTHRTHTYFFLPYILLQTESHGKNGIRMDSHARWPGGGIDLRNTYTCNDPTRSTSRRGVCVRRQWFDSITLLYSQPRLVPGLFIFSKFPGLFSAFGPHNRRISFGS